MALTLNVPIRFVYVFYFKWGKFERKIVDLFVFNCLFSFVLFLFLEYLVF